MLLLVVLFFVGVYQLIWGWKTRRVAIDMVTSQLLTETPKPAADLERAAAAMHEAKFTDDVEECAEQMRTFIRKGVLDFKDHETDPSRVRLYYSSLPILFLHMAMMQ